MSLNYPNSIGGKTPNLIDNSVIVRSKLVVPTLETLPVGYNVQIGSLIYVVSTNTLYIGTQGGLVPIQGATSNMADAPGISGNSIIFNGTGPNLSLKGIRGGNGVTIVVSPNDISIGIDGSGYVGGTDIDITNDVVTNTRQAITYTPGQGVSILGGVINNTGVTTVGSGDTIVQLSGLQSNLLIGLDYQAGPNVTVVGNVISSTIPAGVDIVSAGNTTAVVGGTATNPSVALNYIAGSGISITGTNVINSTVSPIASVTAGNTTVTVGGTPTAPVISGNYQSGSGVSIVGNVISATTHVASISPGNSTIVISGTSTAPIVSSGYIPGNEVTIVGNAISIVPTTMVSLTCPDNTIIINSASSANTVAGNYVGSGGFSIVGNVMSITSPHISTLTAGNTTMTIGGTSTNPIVSGNYQSGNGVLVSENTISNFVQPTGGDLITYNFITNMYVFQGIPSGYQLSLVHASTSAASTVYAIFGFVAMAAMKITDLKIGLTLDPSSAASLMTNGSLIKTAYLCVNGVPVDQIVFNANNFTISASLTGLNIYVPQYNSFSVKISDNGAISTNIRYNVNSWVKGLKNNTTTTLPVPPDITGLASILPAPDFCLFNFSIAPPIQGIRIIYIAGGTAPTSWTDPTPGCVRIYESSVGVLSNTNIGGTSNVIITGLNKSTTYSFRFIAINGNTPPDMSSGVVITSTTTA